MTDGRDGLEMRLVKSRTVFFVCFVLFLLSFYCLFAFSSFNGSAHVRKSSKNIISKCYLHDIFFIPLLDCKTEFLRVQVRASCQTEGLERGSRASRAYDSYATLYRFLFRF